MSAESSESFASGAPREGEAVSVAVVGGGAAGFFAGIAAARAVPGSPVVILERGGGVLAKVRVSGGGRCNVTHHCFDPARLVRHYPRGERELRGPFHRWQPEDTVRWFAAEGVLLKAEPDGRMFPVSNDSGTIVDCLRRAAREAGVRLLTHFPVEAVEVEPGGGFVLRTGDRMVRARSVVVAAGSLKGNPVGETLRRLGHRLTPLVPSLFTFRVAEPRIAGLRGVSVPWVEVGAEGVPETREGPILITHQGFSGPAILRLSAWGARELASRGYQFSFSINWLGGDAPERVARRLEGLRRERARQTVGSRGAMEIPQRIWARLIDAAGIPSDRVWARLGREELRSLVGVLVESRFRANGKSTNKEEFVTCGGVDLREVDFRTFGSRVVPGLYFAGECLDIDGITGGFNFQAAWTGGYLAGTAAAEAAANR